MKTDLRVLGVDTSLRSTGVGVVERRGTQMVPIEFGTIKNGPRKLHSECLQHLHEDIVSIIQSTKPNVAAVEGIFHFKNARTAMVLGQARGVVIAACAAFEIPVYEYAPRRIKQAVVGYGNAHKEQVAAMMVRLLGLDEPPQSDAADALAIAVCHLNSTSNQAAMSPKMI